MKDALVLDLVMLVPGKDERETFDGLLSARRDSLGIRSIRYEILVHPRRDPGCFHEGPDVLQPYQNSARYALIVLDYAGSGQEDRSPEQIAAELKGRMESSGWSGRVEVLLLEPELENWVWSDSPEVDRVVGWHGRVPTLREWLQRKGLWREGETKPARPKECLQEALREAQIRRSSSIYRQLAEKVGLERCRDPVFLVFRRLIRTWFPAEPMG